MSFTTGLTLLFIGLKMAGFIDWSWWLVFTPLIGMFVIHVFIGIVKAVLEHRSKVDGERALNAIKKLASEELSKRNNQ
jgi:hypothetical protein